MASDLRLPEFRFAKRTLANGLDVIVRPERRSPVVALNLWYHVGSKDEERRQRGFAHLFEHLMFEGSEHYPGDFFKPLQRLGAGVNGSTSSDRTNYFVDLPSAHAELALAMESDRMGCLLPALDDHKLRVQKDVVKNEYRQNYANRPYGQVGRLLAEAMYPPDHPYNWLTIGVMEDVEAATRDDVEAFFRRFYVPSNASLCVAGDVDEDRAFALAERYFGPIGGGIKATRPRAPAPGLDADVELLLRDRVELERLYLVWPSAPMFHPDDATLALLADVLTRGKSSRLYEELVVDRELAQDVSAYQSGRELAGSFGVSATLRPGREPAEVRDRVDAALAAVARDGVTPEELERVRNGRLAGFFYALEHVGGFGGVADRLNAYNVYLGDPGRVTSDFDRYGAVTPEDVRRAASRYAAGRPRVALTVTGRKPAVTAPPLDRARPPAALPASRFRPPVPEVRALRCGVPLWVLPRRDLPVVSLSLALGGGGAGSGRGGPAGLASAAAAMLVEGTSTRDARAIALAAERHGTSLSTGCGWDAAYVSLQCLTPHLAAALDLAADVVRDPAFPEAEWRRLRGQTLAGLRAERDSAEARAHRGLLAALYPVGHPYRLPVDGDEAGVAAITRDDLVRFHREGHGPALACCVAAGDVDPDALAGALDDRLDGWAGPAGGPPAVDAPGPGGRPRILLYDRPGAPQAAVRAGHVGLHRLDPDYDAALVLNHVLGGQFNSRLNGRLREEKGFTYGVRSHFDARRGAGPFAVSAALQSDRLAEALDDLFAEVRDLADGRPPTPAELDDARRSLIEGQPRYFETPAAMVSRYSGLHAHGLPVDHHARFAERLDALDVDALRRAATRLVRPQALCVVVVADAAMVAGPLRGLGWAEVTVLGD